MHARARRLHGASGTALSAQSAPTKGLVLAGGWRYDLMERWLDATMFRGQVRALRQRTIELARVQLGEHVLDVGCGTGTLALGIQRWVGKTGRVAGIDPSAEQIARARAKAARRHLPTEFAVGVIERLPFPDQMFDVVVSTLMLHHVGAGLKRQGLAEAARVLKPGGRLVIADFTRKVDRQGPTARFHAGGSSLPDLAAMVTDAGFSQVETQDMPPQRFSAFPGAGFLTARRGESA
jgi:ubiquinone/menaquinone biosynthesis C-methylase UbiE